MKVLKIILIVIVLLVLVAVVGIVALLAYINHHNVNYYKYAVAGGQIEEKYIVLRDMKFLYSIDNLKDYQLLIFYH